MTQEAEHAARIKAFFDLVKAPGDATYRAIHALVTASPRYSPYANDLGTLNGLYAEKRYEECLRKFRQMMPNWMLSPTAHQIACLSAHHLGDEETARMEAGIAESCLQGLLATGDGSHERPYLVSHVEDEYDALRRLGKQLRQQGMIEEEGRHFDCLSCEDGTDVWFDITVMVTHPRALGQP